MTDKRRSMQHICSTVSVEGGAATVQRAAVDGILPQFTAAGSFMERVAQYQRSPSRMHSICLSHEPSTLGGFPTIFRVCRILRCTAVFPGLVRTCMLLFHVGKNLSPQTSRMSRSMNRFHACLVQEKLARSTHELSRVEELHLLRRFRRFCNIGAQCIHHRARPCTSVFRVGVGSPPRSPIRREGLWGWNGKQHVVLPSMPDGGDAPCSWDGCTYFPGWIWGVCPEWCAFAPIDWLSFLHKGDPAPSWGRIRWKFLRSSISTPVDRTETGGPYGRMNPATCPFVRLPNGASRAASKANHAASSGKDVEACPGAVGLCHDAGIALCSCTRLSDDLPSRTRGQLDKPARCGRSRGLGRASPRHQFKPHLADNDKLLATVLGYHAVPPNIPTNFAGEQLTFSGPELSIDFPNNKVAQDVNITAGPVTACLSQIYVIDAVLVPDGFICKEPRQIAEENADLSTLLGILDDTDLQAGPVNPLRTVFAPTNDAFDALLENLGITITELLSDQGRLLQILGYHSIESFLLPDSEGTFEALNGQQLPVDLPGEKVGNGINITRGPINACLSQIFVVDAVLVPPVQTCHSVLDFAVENGFGTLVDLVNAAGLQTELSGIQNVTTVFAPTNEAFATLLSQLGISLDQLKANRALLAEILGYHVVQLDLLPGVVGSFEAFNGQQLAVDLPGRKVGDNVNITSSAGPACLSKVFEIDAVLIPPVLTCQSVIQVAEAQGFTDLVRAVDAAGLRPPLSEPTAALTVFAPTNEAFNAPLTELGLTFEQLAENETLLEQIVLYHVVGGVLPANADGSYETLNGQQLAVNLPGRKAGNNVNITDGPVPACFSEVYVIDAVLLPGDPTPDNEGSKTPYSMLTWALPCGIQLGLLFSWLLV
eukprot:scaffold153_cov347-Pavlova_lutheri.AAC.49